jgi:uncharacterized membrane protein YqjE
MEISSIDLYILSNEVEMLSEKTLLFFLLCMILLPVMISTYLGLKGLVVVVVMMCDVSRTIQHVLQVMMCDVSCARGGEIESVRLSSSYA